MKRRTGFDIVRNSKGEHGRCKSRTVREQHHSFTSQILNSLAAKYVAALMNKALFTLGGRNLKRGFQAQCWRDLKLRRPHASILVSLRARNGFLHSRDVWNWTREIQNCWRISTEIRVACMTVFSVLNSRATIDQSESLHGSLENYVINREFSGYSLRLL